MSDLDLNRRLERIEAALLCVAALEKAFGEKRSLDVRRPDVDADKR